MARDEAPDRRSSPAPAPPLPAGQSPLLVLGKITDILDAFTLARPALSLGEIREATGLPTSTVQRLVTNLVAQGFLDRAGERLRIGVRMAHWAAPAARGLDVLDALPPVLRRVRDATGETACFFRAEQGFRVCVALAETEHALRREMHVGMILPLHAGSAGRVLLAWDPDLLERVVVRDLPRLTASTITAGDELHAAVRQTRSDGWAITTGEREDSASGLSAPVFDSSAQLVGALTVSGPTLRLPRTRCEQLLDLLVSSAEQVTRMLGGRLPA